MQKVLLQRASHFGVRQRVGRGFDESPCGSDEDKFKDLATETKLPKDR